ncbi:hypothetical protein FOZ62_018204, partial [Perkinsus olseni]
GLALGVTEGSDISQICSAMEVQATTSLMISLAGTKDITLYKIINDITCHMPSVDTDKWKAIEAKSNTLSMPASDRNLIMREGYIVIDSLRRRCRESLLEIHQGKLPWSPRRGPLASPKEKKSCLT